MKKTITIIIMAIIIFSCKKDNDSQSISIPVWLQERIKQDEAIMKIDPQSGLEAAAWIRYTYNGNYYFEYNNWLSSSGPQTYNYNGDAIYNLEQLNDYLIKRCCKVFIWKGNAYFGN